MLIIFGLRVFYRTIAQGTFHCRRCGGDRQYRHRAGRRWFTLFFLPVIRHFGWSRAFFSSIVAIAPLSAGLAGVFIGSLLERFGVRKVMITGAAMVYHDITMAHAAGAAAPDRHALVKASVRAKE